MLRAEGLSKTFPGGIKAVEDISLEVGEGEFLCIVGPSGCGKTTFLKMAAGLLPHSAGGITIRGEPVTGPSPQVGMVFQEPALFPWRSVAENIAFGLEITGIENEERRKMAREYAAQVGLAGFEDAFPKTLSGGMAQRCAIARTLINEPDVLLMDEPFGSVDAQLRNRLQKFLVDLWKETKKTVIFVTHNVDEAVYLGDRVAVLSPRPAEVKDVIDVTLPRPRDRTRPDFVEKRRDILELLD